MPEYSSWVPYLQNPLVLAGFVILLITSLAYIIIHFLELFDKEFRKKTLNKILGGAFALSLLVLIMAFVLELRKAETNTAIMESTQKESENSENDLVIKKDPLMLKEKDTVVIESGNHPETHGNFSPAIVNDTGTIIINYGPSQ